MKNLSLGIVLMASIMNIGASKEQFNDIVGFLIGEWENISFEISDKLPVKREAYDETMVGKSEHVLTITAHGYRDGKDLTKDMNLELVGNKIVMRQGNFEASGTREGNVYYLKGILNESEYRFRLYALGDKYVFHRETWKNGSLIQIDMSYLLRKTRTKR